MTMMTMTTTCYLEIYRFAVYAGSLYHDHDISCQHAGVSTASTVQGDVNDGAGGGESNPKTPMPKIKRSDTNVSSASGKNPAARKSKLEPKIQSKSILKPSHSDATMHYSPEKADETPVPDPKHTAAKTRAKPKRKGQKNPPENSPPAKTEDAEGHTAQAVQDALARKATAELPATPASSGKSKTDSTLEKSPKKKKSTVEKSPKKKSTVEKSPKKKKSPKKSSPKKKGSPTKSGATSTPPAPAPKKAASTSSDSSEEDAENEDEGSDTELSLAQLRAKKAAHARYMRFSRSLKSRRAEPQPANMISPQS